MNHTIQRLSLCGILVSLLSLASGPALAENGLRVGSATAKSGETADIPLTLNADGDVQGFQLIFEWDSSKAKGVDITHNDGAGKPLAGADLLEKRVADGFMILAAVLDVDGKDGEKIPAGQNIAIGTASIRCVGPSQGTEEIPLKLVDDKHPRVDGGPNLSNLIAIGGRSIGAGEGLKFHNGTLTCEGEVTPGGQIMFACGGPISDGAPESISGPRGSRQTVRFYYKAPGNGDKIQGLSMAVSYSCDLTVVEDSLDLDGGALKDANAEFIHLEVDNINKTIDKDDCEFTLGVLIDAVAPFDGRTLPVTRSLKKLFEIDVEIEDDADCGKCYWLKFMDGLNGNGTPPVKNLVSINFQSQKPQLMHCQICVEAGEASFIRGDCNFSNMGSMSVDIADAAAAVGYFFFTGNAKFNAPCDDACDANDDGRLDAADVVFILNYLFIPHSPKPPKPGPTSAGTDPTKDDLGCKGGNKECN